MGLGSFRFEITGANPASSPSRRSTSTYSTLCRDLILSGFVVTAIIPYLHHPDFQHSSIPF